MNYKPNTLIVKHLAERTKCLMCKHQEDEGHLLPKGKFSPSPKWLFHYEDTHGLPHDMVYEWLFQLPYQKDNGDSLLRDDNGWAFR